MFLKPQINGNPASYFCGHSLGLQPVSAKEYITQELDKWAENGVDGHFEEPNPWFDYHQLLKPGLAKLCGAKVTEVVAYGSLSSNLHTLFASFYTPTIKKFKILTEDIGFPSDNFALQTQVQFHGFEPKNGLIYLSRNDQYCFDTEYIIQQIEKHHEELALIWLSGVNFLSGQVLDMSTITATASKYNIKIGLDLAHAIGNVPLQLHNWGVDFAVWCSYKYLNAGPGAVGGYYVHEKNFPKLTTQNLQPKTILGGWWGHNEKTRFQTEQKFEPIQSADAWQHSNANVLSLASLRSSLDIFLSQDLERLLNQSRQQTQYAFEMLKELKKVKILTPENLRGNMMAIQVSNQNKEIIPKLKEQNIVADWREPGILRFSYCPLYNAEFEWKHFMAVLHELL